VDPDLITHGDLVPGNLVVRDGRLAGVLDVGGLGAADPAVDLVVAWHVLDDEPRATCSATSSPSTISDGERGMAWAFQQAMGLVWYYETSNPTMSAIGRRTLDRILAARRPACGSVGSAAERLLAAPAT
jgi:aminoglycoside phosphotransferase (APT) family kinase protein